MAESHSPIDVAQRLARIYGHKLERPVVYTQGVALSGRLRLHALNPLSSDPGPEIARIVAPYMDDPTGIFDERAGTANYAGVCWADELSDATGDDMYEDLLLTVASRFEEPSAEDPIRPPLDKDIRVEDFFFAGTLLGRAYRLSGEERHLDILTTFLLAADTLQSNGLWWHCKASPYFWGRGNAFAAMGFAEALTYLPGEHQRRDELLEKHLRHLEGLRERQDESGMWHQVIDRPDTYLEHSATSMIGYAVARGVRAGWLEPEWRAVVERAWQGVSERIGAGGELEHVCVGTGPLSSLDGYVSRPYSDGLDDRGGSMALWFAVEMARLKRESQTED